jgi:hypothetical protein
MNVGTTQMRDAYCSSGSSVVASMTRPAGCRCGNLHNLNDDAWRTRLTNAIGLGDRSPIQRHPDPRGLLRRALSLLARHDPTIELRPIRPRSQSAGPSLVWFMRDLRGFRKTNESMGGIPVFAGLNHGPYRASARILLAAGQFSAFCASYFFAAWRLRQRAALAWAGFL